MKIILRDIVTVINAGDYVCVRGLSTRFRNPNNKSLTFMYL